MTDKDTTLRVGSVIYPPVEYRLYFSRGPIPLLEFADWHTNASLKPGGDPVLKVTDLSFYGSVPGTIWVGQPQDPSLKKRAGIAAFCAGRLPNPGECLKVRRVGPESRWISVEVLTPNLPEEEIKAKFKDPFLFSTWEDKFGSYKCRGIDVGLGKFQKFCSKCCYLSIEGRSFRCKHEDRECLQGIRMRFVDRSQREQEVAKEQAFRNAEEILGYPIRRRRT